MTADHVRADSRPSALNHVIAQCAGPSTGSKRTAEDVGYDDEGLDGHNNSDEDSDSEPENERLENGIQEASIKKDRANEAYKEAKRLAKEFNQKAHRKHVQKLSKR